MNSVSGCNQVVVSLRSLLQDRMAALNGRTVEYVLKQDKAAFIRLIGLSVAQVSSLIRPFSQSALTHFYLLKYVTLIR